jgi:hypothetical protein
LASINGTTTSLEKPTPANSTREARPTPFRPGRAPAEARRGGLARRRRSRRGRTEPSPRNAAYLCQRGLWCAVGPSLATGTQTVRAPSAGSGRLPGLQTARSHLGPTRRRTPAELRNWIRQHEAAGYDAVASRASDLRGYRNLFPTTVPLKPMGEAVAHEGHRFSAGRGASSLTARSRKSAIYCLTDEGD